MRFVLLSTIALLACACQFDSDSTPQRLLTVADTPTHALDAMGAYISWQEHRIDDEDLNGGIAIRGGDGLKLADLDGDGRPDVVSVHEDSHHLRIAYGTDESDHWNLFTVAAGKAVGAIEDVAVGDLSGDGLPDLVVACEIAHLAYFQNPGGQMGNWPGLLVPQTQGRGSWLQVDLADLTGDGRLEVIGANKGFEDVVRAEDATGIDNATSLFRLAGDPLDADSWQEQVLMQDGIPNQALTADVDGDGDLDVLTASREDYRMYWLRNDGVAADGTLSISREPIVIRAGFPTEDGWVAAANAFNAEFADLDGDGRLDLLVNVLEFHGRPPWRRAGLGWLRQGETLTAPWTLHRIGTLLPDWVIGIGTADFDGDGDLDAVAGGYSGLNILGGGYSGASRDADDPAVTAADSVARLAWFENPGNPRQSWPRHDISRRVRGMYDEFAFADLNGDGALDIIATRGNSGHLDGVFWLEQRRSRRSLNAFAPARTSDSRALALPPDDWRARYGRRVEYRAPNKSAQERALQE